MPETIIFGLQKATWEVVNGWGNWAAAFGSLAAAGVALWIALRSGRVKLNCAVGMRVLAPLRGSSEGEYIAIRVVNAGDRRAVIDAVYWEFRTSRGKNRVREK
jgi:hypothetical protein